MADEQDGGKQTAAPAAAAMVAVVALVLAVVMLVAIGVALGTQMGQDKAKAMQCPPTGGTGSVPPGTHKYDLGDSQDSAKALAQLVGDRWNIDTIGGWRPADRYGEHSTGRALDIMVSDGRGDEISQYLIDNAASLGVDNVIWKQQIWSARRADEGRRPMEDRGSPTQNHMDHVHTFLAEGAPVTQQLPGLAAAVEGAPPAPAPAPGPLKVVPSAPYRGASSAETHGFTADAQVLGNIATIVRVANELWPDDKPRAERAALIATITTAVETQGRNMASSSEPESLKFPHQGVGSDHDSVGMFQQRVSGGYGTIAQLMDPDYGTRAFFGRPGSGAPANMTWGLEQYQAQRGKDWMEEDPGDVAANIQRPAASHRYRYGLWVPAVPALIQAASGMVVDPNAATPTNCLPAAPGSVPGVDTYGPMWKDTNGGADGVDPWNFFWGECVSYTAWHVRTQTRHTDFENNWQGAHFGNAKEWERAAKATNIPVDENPAVGSIALRRSGSAGHVAVVTAVNGNTIDVAEYNFGSRHRFGERKGLDWRAGGEFVVFLHFEQ